MLNKFILIWDKSGSNFLFKYLKEVMRLTVRRLSNSPLEPSDKIFVKLGKSKFPAIIPKEICDDLLNVDKHFRRNLIIAVLSLISLFRVLPTKVKPDISTITDPFNGVSKEIDDVLLINSLKVLNMFKKGSKLGFSLNLSQKAGPNGKVSMLNTAIDALSLLLYPRIFISFMIFNHKLFKNCLGLFINL
jgi:hypothetical protein